MKTNELTFVSFEPKNLGFEGFLSLESLAVSEKNPEILLQRATKIYEKSISKMGHLLDEIDEKRTKRKPLAARKIWSLGEMIFKLREDLAKLSLQLDSLYDHLVRDLNVKRKWLEKVVIFRRYLSKKSLIPASIRWGQCEKGTRRVAERINRGLSPR